MKVDTRIHNMLTLAIGEKGSRHGLETGQIMYATEHEQCPEINTTGQWLRS